MNTKNSQYGTHWITDGSNNRKILGGSPIPEGWVLGRVKVHTEQSRKILSEKCRNNNPEKRIRTTIERYGSLYTPNRSKAINKFWLNKRNELMNRSFESKSIPYKRLHIIEEQGGKCLHCGLGQWRGLPIKLELDHIDGNKNNNMRDNLRFLCPNCHSFTETWRRRKADVA